jgi:hypothetical protein
MFGRSLHGVLSPEKPFLPEILVMQKVFEHILSKIRKAEIIAQPFQHLVIPQIMPSDFYPKLLGAIPKPEQFISAAYPGTGFGKGKLRWSGLAYPDLQNLRYFSDLQVFLRSETFCRTLLDKFARPGGIPPEKYRFFANDAHEFSSVFDLQIDRRGYEILPHPDVPSKIVTFQFYLTCDDSLREFGTLLCRTKNGRPPRRSRRALNFRRHLEHLAKGFGGHPIFFWEWLARTRMGTAIGFGDSRSWFPWRMFDVVSSTPALPNHFMAFAPNEHSYHAVRMNIPKTSFGRTVLRGFIRSGRSSSNFIKLKQSL